MAFKISHWRRQRERPQCPDVVIADLSQIYRVAIICQRSKLLHQLLKPLPRAVGFIPRQRRLDRQPVRLVFYPPNMDFRRLTFLRIGVSFLKILSCPKIVAGKLIARSWKQIEQLYFRSLRLLVHGGFTPYPVVTRLEDSLFLAAALTFFSQRDIG